MSATISLLVACPASQTVERVTVSHNHRHLAHLVGAEMFDISSFRLAGRRIVAVFDDEGLFRQGGAFVRVYAKGGPDLTLSGRVAFAQEGVDPETGEPNFASLSEDAEALLRPLIGWASPAFAKRRREYGMAMGMAQAVARGYRVEDLPGGLGFVVLPPGIR